MLEELQRRNYSHRTAKTYVRIVRDFAGYFHQPPDKLGPEHIREYQAHLFQSKKLAPATVSQYVSALRFSFIKTLHRHFLAEYIPFPKARKRLPTVLSPEEVARLIDSARNLYHRTLLMTLYSTAMRRAELCRLKVRNVDSKRRMIRIHQGKGSRDRDVPLSPKLLETLRVYWRWMQPTTFLFPGMVKGVRADVPITPNVVWLACQHAARASEGLKVLVLEKNAPGGQAGSSSRIENYLGFPMGISGEELSNRAFVRAEKFGAHIAIAQSAIGLKSKLPPYTVELEGGRSVRGQTVIIAAGSRYRRLDLPNLSQLEGVGVYYGATQVEATVCREEEVAVVGGGNSAGQAAVFLAGTAKHVYLVVRGPCLAKTMSRYLISRIEANPRITLMAWTTIEELEGDTHLKRVRLHNTKTGANETRDIQHVFMMTGADPNTEWLRGSLALDAKGFIKTGAEVQDGWPLHRPPYLLETSLPGVFAVGDIRAESVKRVASAVGEGSMVVQFVHKVLAE